MAPSGIYSDQQQQQHAVSSRDTTSPLAGPMSNASTSGGAGGSSANSDSAESADANADSTHPRNTTNPLITTGTPEVAGIPPYPSPSLDTHATGHTSPIAPIPTSPLSIATTTPNTPTTATNTTTNPTTTTPTRAVPPSSIPIPSSSMPIPFFSSNSSHSNLVSASASATASARHNAPYSSYNPHSYSTPALPSTAHSPLQIILNSDRLICRGVAGNLEPARLSGHVVLTLTEATNIKDITLDLVGKAKIPTGERTNQSSINPTIFSHHWSFLPDAGHKHTIKEGRHVFPFQLDVSASLPASMMLHPPSTVSAAVHPEIYYKLRATAVRSSAFASNWHTSKPVFVIKAFSWESLEYTQSLEVENTWPGKVMYSIMIPHKAYAAGDTIPALMRFTPTAKGVTVLSVGMELTEYAHVKWPRVNIADHVASSTRTVTVGKWMIKGGKAVKNTGSEAGPSGSGSGSSQQQQHPSGSGASTPGVTMAESPLASGSTTPPASQSIPEGKRVSHGSRSTSLKNLMNLVGGNASSSNGQAADLAMTSPSNSRPPSRVPSASAVSALVSSSASVAAAAASTSSSGALGSRAAGKRAMFTLGGGSGNGSPSEMTPRTSQEDVRTSSASASGSGSGPGSSSATAPPSINDSSAASSTTAPTTSAEEEDITTGDDEINTRVGLQIPLHTVPSHSSHVSVGSSHTSNTAPPYALPLAVAHKVRFSVMLSNLDGHTSELRCALPVHIMDARLKKEVRAATRVTREILLGRRRRRRRDGNGAARRLRHVELGADVLGDAGDNTPAPDLGAQIGENLERMLQNEAEHEQGGLDGAEDDDYSDEDDDEDGYEDEDDEDDEPAVELPSYNSHVHDRLANADLDYSASTPELTTSSTPSGTAPSSYSVPTGGYFGFIPITAGASGASSPRHQNQHHHQSDWQHFSQPGSPRGGIVHPAGGNAPNANGGTDRLAFGEELIASLGEVAASRQSTSSSAPRSSLWMTPANSSAPPSRNTHGSGGGRSGFWSTSSSRAHSRANSRAPSPEPGERERERISGSDDTMSSATHGSSLAAGTNTTSSTKSSGLFHLPSSLKPLSALTSSLRPHPHQHHHSSSAGSFPSLHPEQNASSARRTRSRPPSPTPPPESSRSSASSSSNTALDDWHFIPHPQAQPRSGARHQVTLPATLSMTSIANANASGAANGSLLSRVPSYGAASRPGASAVPPLGLYRDLPTYDEASATTAAADGVPSGRPGEGRPPVSLGAVGRSRSEISLMTLRQHAHV